MTRETHYERWHRHYASIASLRKVTSSDEVVAQAWHRTQSFLKLVREACNRPGVDPYTLETPATDPAVNAALRKDQRALMRLGISEVDGLPLHDQYSTLLSMLWQMECHRRAGEKVYEVSPGLADRLAKTELRGLRTPDLKLPFKNIYLQVPAEAGLSIPNPVTGDHEVEGIYVTDTPMGWHLLAVGVSKADELDDALFHFLMRLPDDTAVPDLEFPDHPSTAGLFRFAMNATVYATKLPNAQIDELAGNRDFRLLEARMSKLPPGKKKDRLKGQLRGVPAQRRIYLGRDVRKTGVEEGTSTPGTAPSVATLVRGHWRNQPYGPRHTLRRLTWIQPFWRNVDAEELSNPRYILD